MSDAVPVTVIGGYLGSGKTTFVNHLLRHARGRKLAVLVNDFGALPIDADLIETEREDVISIAGGCVCCSFGSDLITALDRLSRERPEITDVLIESSGVALPSAIAESVSLMQRYRLSGVVVLCDVTTAMKLSTDRYLGDSVVAQIQGADIILLNKIDLADDELQDHVANWLRSLTSTARILRTREGRVPVEAVLHQSGVTVAAIPRPMVHDTSIYRTTHVSIAGQVRAGDLARALAETALGLLRAKAILRDETGNTVQLSVVGPRWNVTPCESGAIHPGHLVTIGLQNGADQQAIEQLVGHHVLAAGDAD